MVSLSFRKSAILLITALILIQGAAALTIVQAPLNPAFVAYTEGMDTGGIEQTSFDSYGYTELTDAPYATGLAPSPALVVWPDGYAADTVNADTTLPASFDLRDVGRVTPIRDQGKVGSCWAFATYGSLESTWLTDTGNAENFSENNMKNLCSNLYPDGFDYGPRDGGVTFMSTAYLARGSGPVQEADDPYALPYPSNISSTSLPPVLDVRDVTFLPPRTGPLDNTLFKQTLRDEGALGVSFFVNWSCFADNYSTYYWPGEEYAIDVGHAVTLVGWNDTFPKDAFAITPPGDGAFILKNSWGTHPGDEGYFYISYYDPSLGYFWNDEQTYYGGGGRSTPGVLFTGVAADPDKHIYQYDPLGWTNSIGTSVNTLMMGANVFTAERYEEVTDVSFYTREPGTQYAAVVFTGTAPPAADDIPVTWTTGTINLPGYHTVSFPETVPLTPGESFSVILMVYSPTDTYPLVVEMPIEGYSSKATAEPGESYVSIDGDNWEDLTEIFPDTNACIKAHTRPLTVVPRDYLTIQEAVNASADGDTIIVKAGTYPEALELEQPITLFGVGMPIVATPTDEIGVECEADNITITGFTFDGNGAARGGIGILGNDTTLSDIEITGYEDGLYISFVNGLSLSRTAVHDNDNNLQYADLQENPGNTITETVTVNGRPVIYREGVSGETIDASSNAGTVICVNVTDMIIQDITTETIKDGIFLFGCRDVIIENITADEVYTGVRAYSSENIIVQDSSFGPDAEYGMRISGITGFLAEGNEIVCRDGSSEIYLTDAGIYLTDAEDTTISNNTITSGINGAGVLGLRMSNSSVTGNILIGDEIGIGIANGENVAVSNNMVETSSQGIFMQMVQNILVSDNTIQCNDMGFGMLMLIADGADIVGNTVENCSIQAGMVLNNSVVRENHFSGAAYPVIIIMESEEDVFVYRNDFVLTADEAGADAFAADLTGTDSFRQDMQTVTDATPDISMWSDGLLNDGYTNGAFGTLAMSAPDAAPRHLIRNTPVWHSPTEETYWYYGRAFTQTMGNYWSTYNGTDTTYDGIGETPFTIRNNESDICPLVNPIARYFNENPLPATDEDASADMATSGALSAGESAKLSFTGSAVQTVTVTAAQGTGRILLTVDRAGTGPDGLEGSVYQYISAELSGMTDEEIAEAEFSFRVPAAWLGTEGMLPTAITLWRFHDGTWQELPTSLVREEAGWIYYEATTPGFSSFAIAAGDGQRVTVTTDVVVPGEAGMDTTNITVTAEPVNETASEAPVTVAMPGEEDTKTPTGTTPQQSPLGLLAIIGGAAGAALLFRKRE